MELSNLAIDVIFALDMLLNFFLGYYDRRMNQLVFDHSCIVRRYVFTWFAFDFVAVFPFKYVLGLDNLGRLRLVRAMRLLKLAKAARLGEQFSLRSQHQVLIKFGLGTLLMLHWVSCAWCLIAQLQRESGHLAWTDNDNLNISGSGSRYLHAVEFSIFAMVLTYSRAHPVTVVEQIFAVVALMLMGCIYAYAIGTVCGIIATMDPAGTEFKMTKDLVRSWATEMQMSSEIQTSLIEYLDECRWIIRQRYYEKLRGLLSPTLRGEISHQAHEKWLRNVPFFTCGDPFERRRFTVAIAERLTLTVFGKSEVIVAAGELADSLYIIARGVAARTTGVVLCHGRYFGAEMLLRQGKHPTSCHSVTFVTVNQLTKKHLFQVLASGSGKFPHTWRSIRKWIVRQSFARLIRTIVHIRRATIGYNPMSHKQFLKERERLIRIGRTGAGGGGGAASAGTSDPSEQEPEPPPISQQELSLALSRITKSTESEHSETLEQIEYAFNGVKDELEKGGAMQSTPINDTRADKLEKSVEVRPCVCYRHPPPPLKTMVE